MSYRPVAIAAALLLFPPVVCTQTDVASAAGAAEPQAGLSSAADGTILIPMRSVKEQRGKTVTGLFSLLFADDHETLNFRGDIVVNGESFAIYLPEEKPYRVRNSAESDRAFDNDATLLSIDQNGDGILTDIEGIYANLPLRVGDTMFRCTAIASDGSSITLQPLDGPLRGLVVGRPAAPFAWTTVAGKEVTLAGSAGKALLIDIWSPT